MLQTSFSDQHEMDRRRGMTIPHTLGVSPPRAFLQVFIELHSACRRLLNLNFIIWSEEICENISSACLMVYGVETIGVLEGSNAEMAEK
jgi:hypothetical protein